MPRPNSSLCPFKECCHELARPLSTLFSLCLRSGVQPAAWKTANVVPVYKKASRSLPANYRPVSLLSICSKVMEGIINHQLVNYLERHHLLSARQFGFRRGLGTADLLTVLNHERTLTTGSGGCTMVLAVDIAGALDKVSHIGVTYKLQTLGVRGRALTWLTDYLSLRKLQAVVNGQSSSPYPIESGVPQGAYWGQLCLGMDTQVLTCKPS